MQIRIIWCKPEIKKRRPYKLCSYNLQLCVIIHEHVNDMPQITIEFQMWY